MKGVIYLEDICKELSEEFQIGPEELEEMFRKSFNHINNLTLNPEVISITLPTLGTLHLNEKRAKGLYKHSTHYIPYQDIIEKQLKIIEGKYKNNKDSVHSRRSYTSYIKKFFYPERRERTATPRGELYKKMEAKQNKTE